MADLATVRRPRAGVRALFAYRPGLVDWAIKSGSSGVQRGAGGQLETVDAALPRSGHFVRNPASGLYERATLLEQARTNLLLYSELLSAWNDVDGAVLAGGQSGPDLLTNAWLVDDQSTTAHAAKRSQLGGVSGDGTKVMTLIAKAGTAGKSGLGWRDATANVLRHAVLITWNGAAAPTVTTVSGAGTVYAPIPLVNGWWAISASVDGVLAASANELWYYPAGNEVVTSTGTGYFFAAQAENARYPSSYFKTTGTVATRAVDQLRFAYPSGPQAMTAYVRMVVVGWEGSARVLTIGTTLASNTSSFGLLMQSATSARAYMSYGSGSVESNVTGGITIGDMIEMRGVITAAGAVALGRAINGGAEQVGPTSAAVGLPAAWSAGDLWLNSQSSGALAGSSAITHAHVFPGERDLATCRQKAGV